MKNKFTAGLIIACIGVALLTGQAWGKIPQNMNLQGKVVDSTGKSLADGVYNFEVTLFKRGQQDALYKNVIRNVAVTNGMFSAVLDTLDPAMFNDEIEVQVRVGTETFAAKQITAVPYALNASRLEGKTLDQIKTEIGSAESGPFTFANNGKVGLGTNDPDYALDIVGDLRVKGMLRPWSLVPNDPFAKLQVKGALQVLGNIYEGDKLLGGIYAQKNETLISTIPLKVATVQLVNVAKGSDVLAMNIGPNKNVYSIDVVFSYTGRSTWVPLGVEDMPTYDSAAHPRARARYEQANGQVYVSIASSTYGPNSSNVNVMVTYSD